ncbi:type II toxin-antitoxin system VapC family toxin, partial [Candidatus Dependentiae bacterium]|nr:type II toxin-antitoxin system VapC family toxin [Candidatus Dependentiae bacterium]
TYLIDTHILLWWLANDKKLTKKIRNVIQDPENHIFVSSVSVWEVSIKKALGKLRAPDNLKEAVIASDIQFLSMTVDHALYLSQLPAIHNDPFDRLLIAQCLVEDLVFITADTIIPRYEIKIF